jgi:hypothetical protein
VAIRAVLDSGRFITLARLWLQNGEWKEAHISREKCDELD